MSSLRRFLRGALLLYAAALHAETARRSSNDVKLLLFRTEVVQHLHIQVSGSGVVQMCSTCAPRSGPASLDLQRQGNAMLDGGKPTLLHSVMVQGSATVETGEHHRAQVAGKWWIDVEHDRLRVRVQMPRERYVEAVLASEADPAEPPASLRALAIVARSFAAAVPERHPAGTLCDTTHCQALRLEPVRQAVHDAVWSTSGETLWYGRRQVPGYFSQHCGGITEDASRVWGGTAMPWLAAHADPWCARVPSQWHASLPEVEVRRALMSEGIATAGQIVQILPIERDRSGRVQQLRLRSPGATQTVPAATFRFAINRALGWNQIRSDRYQVQRIGDRLVFEGSGFGHGVGLCQAGAAAMGRAGKTEREIVQMYLPGTTIRIQAGDNGWMELAESGFLLRTTERNSTMEADAASAFADARARWSRPLNAKPTVTMFPTTEAFRQATGQAGWTLATTQGSSIATQPGSVLRANGGVRLLLRHEFLHSFVEAESSTAAPLWLREGWVAVLNGEACADAGHQRTPEQVDAALRAAGSLAQSQQAHHAACALTQQYLQQHGADAAQRLLAGR